MKTGKILSALLLVVLAACSNTEEEKEIIRPVKAIQIENLANLNSQKNPAISKESNQATLAFRISGPLVKFDIKEGNAIKKGQLIAEIDPRDFRVDLASKKASFEQKKAEAERYRALYEKKSIPKNELDKYEAAYLMAQTAYVASQNALKDTKLIAPFSGFVQKKFVDNFEKVREGQDIVSLIDLSAIEIDLYISENLAIHRRSFDSFTVEFDAYPNKIFNATFLEMGKSAQGGEGVLLTLVLETGTQNEKSETPVGAGMSCNVNIQLNDKLDLSSSVITIPLSAVFEPDTSKTPSVWLFDPKTGIVTKKDVKIGKLTLEKSVEILEGLNNGDWVITAGVSKLSEGQKVRLLTEIK